MKRLSWNAFEKAVFFLGNKIKSDKFDPEIILAVTNGGLFPAILIKPFFFNAKIKMISARHYGPFTFPIKISCNNLGSILDKRVLIIDDVCETGETLKAIKKIVIKRNPKQIKIACLLLKSHSTFLPDYFFDKSRVDISMPWFRFSKKVKKINLN